MRYQLCSTTGIIHTLNDNLGIYGLNLKQAEGWIKHYQDDYNFYSTYYPNMDILDRYFTDGIATGCLKKPSGVIMEYKILVYGTDES